MVKIDQQSKMQGSILVVTINRMAVFGREPLAVRATVSQNSLLEHFRELRGAIMKSYLTFAGALCVAIVCLLTPEASALAASAQFMKTGGFLAIAAVLGAVVLCLVIGVALRSFSKPPTDLSLNQRTK